VDGVYTADPAVVADAKHLPELSYPVMQEMATAGAKVLNAQAVQFAKEKNIAIYARSTFADGKETIVRKIPAGSITGVQAVVSESDITRLRIHSEKALPYFQETLRFLEKEQVPIKEVNVMTVESDPAQSRASLVIPSLNVYGWEEVRKTLEQRLGAAVAFDTHLSALSLIGEGINRNNLTLLETVDLLQANNIVPSGIVTTSFRISLLVNRAAVQEGMRLCHRKWITGLV
jgi:aspartate kinase